MPDQKPPRLAADDHDTLRALLQFQRDSFVRKVSGVDLESAAASPVASGTSLLWLTNHIADAEATWVLSRFAGTAPAEGAGAPAPTVNEAVARYQRTWHDVDAVLDGAPNLDAKCPGSDDQPPGFDDQQVVNLRWILAHLLEETARHAGHADILRELIDGQTGR